MWETFIIQPMTNVLLWIYDVLGHGPHTFGLAIILFTILIRAITWPLNASQVKGAQAMQEFMGRALPIDVDTVIAGAILADVGKLLEYELGPDGKSRQSERGEALRHPFTGVALALECGVPDAVCHIIAAHAAEGDLVKRTTEAYIVHHADFMAFLPFKNPKNVKVK